MGFKEAIKKLGLGDLLNLLKIEVDNSKHYEIKDSVLHFDTTSGDKIIYTLPNTVSFDNVKDVVGELYKKGVSGFVRTDLALPEIGMISAREQNEDLFKRYKHRIKTEYYHAMIAAYTVIEFEDREDIKTSRELFEGFIKRYPKFGRHIYNFCRSGLMGGFFWNELGFIMVEGATEPMIRERFSKIFDDYVKFYPHGIWVAPFMDFDDVIKELRKRLNIKEVQRLDIYFRGKEKMDLCDDIIDLIDQKDSLTIEAIERYSICYSICKRVSIAKIPDKFKTF